MYLSYGLFLLQVQVVCNQKNTGFGLTPSFANYLSYEAGQVNSDSIYSSV
jgi:hypothetical protein